MTDIQERDKSSDALGRALTTVVKHPVAIPAASISIFLLIVVANFVIGRSAPAVLAGAIIATVVVTVLAAIVALGVAASYIHHSGVDGLADAHNGLHDAVDHLTAAVQETNAKVAALNTTIPLALGNASVLTETQYAEIEGSERVVAVFIAIPEMGREFSDDIDVRDSLVDFAAIVMKQLRAGTSYTYITKATPSNETRFLNACAMAADEAPGKDHLLTAVPVEISRWQQTPFNTDTAFLRDSGGHLDAYQLLPGGNDRLWVRLNAEPRDEWWGIVRHLLDVGSSGSPTDWA